MIVASFIIGTLLAFVTSFPNEIRPWTGEGGGIGYQYNPMGRGFMENDGENVMGAFSRFPADQAYVFGTRDGQELSDTLPDVMNVLSFRDMRLPHMNTASKRQPQRKRRCRDKAFAPWLKALCTR